MRGKCFSIKFAGILTGPKILAVEEGPVKNVKHSGGLNQPIHDHDAPLICHCSKRLDPPTSVWIAMRIPGILSRSLSSIGKSCGRRWKSWRIWLARRERTGQLGRAAAAGDSGPGRGYLGVAGQVQAWAAVRGGTALMFRPSREAMDSKRPHDHRRAAGFMVEPAATSGLSG